MSGANFDPRDRWDNRTIGSEYGAGRVRLMSRSGGYVMVRKPHCMPFVLTEKEWAKLPLLPVQNSPNVTGPGTNQKGDLP